MHGYVQPIWPRGSTFIMIFRGLFQQPAQKRKAPLPDAGALQKSAFRDRMHLLHDGGALKCQVKTEFT